MDDEKPNSTRVAPPPAAPKSAGCTPLERRLSLWCCFLSVLVLNAMLRIFVWPRVSGSPYLIFVVIGARIVVGVSWVRLYQRLTGEECIDPLVQTAVGFLPTILVDLALGGCYRSCSVKWAVWQPRSFIACLSCLMSCFAPEMKPSPDFPKRKATTDIID